MGTAVWPLSADAQQTGKLTAIGYLSARSPDDTAHLLEAFRRGLNENGFVEGRNVMIEYRWARGRYDQLPMMAVELVQRPVAILVSTGGEPAALAAKAATSTIPIVFAIGGDLVKLGLVASYGRPGGNATGVDILTNTLEAKRIGLLHELVPQANIIGVLLDPGNTPAVRQLGDIEEAARALGLQTLVLRASTDPELDAAFEILAQRRVFALTVAAAPFFDTRRDKLVALAQTYAIPTIYQFREYADAGGPLHLSKMRSLYFKNEFEISPLGEPH
jgi:putative ABC transport system substrate-binding protein